jgi:hypothetical protein
MALVSTIVDRVLKGFQRHASPDLLTTALIADPTDQNVSYLGILSGWGVGAKVEIGNEILLIKENDAENKTASVVRGWLGTEVAAHPADTPIYIEPRTWRSDVLDLFNDCLEDMYGHDLYAVGALEKEYDPSLIGYDLAAEVVRILRVDVLDDSASSYWKPIADYYLMDNAPDDFPSGKALMSRASLPFGSAMRVVYTKAFTQITSEANDLATNVGLRPYMNPLLYYFTMNRMMVDEERRRSQISAAQSHQRAQDTPPFLSLRTGEWYQARYQDRIITARKRLTDETRRVSVSGYGS